MNMEKRKSYLKTCVAIGIYVMLIFLFFYLARDIESKGLLKYENCTFRNTCLSFCEQQVTEKFTDEYILRNFPFEDFPTFRNYEDDNKTVDFRVLKQSIECDSVLTKIIVENHKDFKIYSGGDVSYKDDFVYLNHYCLQPFESSGKINVKLEICIFEQPAYESIHIVLLTITAILLIIPLVVYVDFKEIRSTFHGQLCIALLVSQIYTVIIITAINEDVFSTQMHYFLAGFAHFIGVFSSNFVANLMVFDIFLTFKHFYEPNYRSKYFRHFVYFLIGYFIIALIYNAIMESSMVDDFTDALRVVLLIMLFAFALTTVLNIIGLVLAFYYLVKLSRSTNDSDTTRFDVEKERLWLYVKLFAIITVALNIHIFSEASLYAFESKIVADVMKCYSAALGAFLLIWTPKVHAIVFQRYSTIKNDLEAYNS